MSTSTPLNSVDNYVDNITTYYQTLIDGQNNHPFNSDDPNWLKEVSFHALSQEEPINDQQDYTTEGNQDIT